MMKRTLLLIFTVLLGMAAYSQKTGQKHVPLFWDTPEEKKVTTFGSITDGLISESLKTFPQIDLRFKHPIGDVNYPVILKKAELYSLQLLYPKNTYYSKYDRPDSKKSNEDAYIWKLCEEKLIYWFKNQPYNKIIRPTYGDYLLFPAFSLRGPLYLVPEKQKILGAVAYSQKTGQKRVPLFWSLPKEKNIRLLTITDSFSDTIKTEFCVKLEFSHPVSDSRYPVVLKKVELIQIKLYHKGNQNPIWISNESEKSGMDAYIWTLCEENLCYWFANQPYNKIPHLADRLGDTQINQTNRVYGVVYIVPGKK